MDDRQLISYTPCGIHLHHADSSFRSSGIVEPSENAKPNVPPNSQSQRTRKRTRLP